MIDLLSRLRLPLMAAPMSIASNLDLVMAAMESGILGCFPTHNAHRSTGLNTWVGRLSERAEILSHSGRPGLFAVNINVSSRKTVARLTEELAVCRHYGVPVITSNAGDPARLVEQVHDWGGLVIHDVSTVEQAEKAALAGVDGLMLVCNGAGGLGGNLNPFAFVPAVRTFFGGLIQLAGGISDGRGLAAARLLGADMVCMGTRFIATRESGVVDGHKQMLVDAKIHDVLWTDAICGIPGSFLKPSIRANGLDPEALPVLVGGWATLPAGVRPWEGVWSGGQSIGGISDIVTVAELVARIEREYQRWHH